MGLYNLIAGNLNTQSILDYLRKSKIAIEINIFIHIALLVVFFVFYLIKRDNISFGFILCFLIGLFGFFGLFVAKEKEERKDFFFGWTMCFVIKTLLFIFNLLAVYFSVVI